MTIINSLYQAQSSLILLEHGGVVADVRAIFRNPNNQTAITAVNKFANILAARFNPTVGCTRSWDSTDPTDFQV